MGVNDCESCTTCAACDRPFCRDNEVSPGEMGGLCSECWDKTGGRTEADLLAAHDGAGFVSREWSVIAENDTELGAWWAPALTDEGRAR